MIGGVVTFCPPPPPDFFFRPLPPEKRREIATERKILGLQVGPERERERKMPEILDVIQREVPPKKER